MAWAVPAEGETATPCMTISEFELGFLEPETAARYPNPAPQVNLDLSQVSYIATANALDPIPAPLRDRFRIVDFPKPRAEDLDLLLPPVLADIAAERGLDTR
jgi:hypothetical protein